MSSEVPVLNEAATPQNPGGSADAVTGIPDESQIVWKEAISANGSTFLVGSVASNADTPSVPTIHAQAITASFSINSSNHRVECDVHWPVGDDSWKQPSAEVFSQLKIAQYCVTTPAWPRLIYDYIVWIQPNQNYAYYFTDETGDTYSIDCYLTNGHYVKYNSDKPTIVKVARSRDTVEPYVPY